MKNLISLLEVLVISGCFVGFFNSKSVAAEPEKTNLSEIDSQTDTEPIYPEGLISIPDDPRFSKYVFVVGKKERTLWIYERNGEKLKVIEKFETDMGKNDGEKTKANDRKTPIGIYFLQSRLAPPEIPYKLYGSQAFTTDYPNVFDKRDARTGSGIWLHAVPNTVPLTRGSRGCVVVRDEVIKKLGQYIHLKQTPLVIYKEINFLTFEQHQKNKKKFLDFFEKWRSSWESEDIDSYIRFYDDTFRNDKMDLNAWIRHKKKMRGLYSDIKVDLSTPLIISNKDQVVMRTNQRYKSNLHEDFGEKTIHARGSPQDGLFGFKIIREDWQPIAENQP
jgi:murein L,D-transpeptidase YafK